MLQRYEDYQPTTFDRKGAFLDDGRQEWLVAPIGTNRDADCLTRSNWDSMIATLEHETDDDETETWEEHSFNHWGPGWFSIVIVKPGSVAESLVTEMARALEDYPVLDDELFSQYETDEAELAWTNLSLHERFDLCQEASGVSIFAARHDYPPSDDQGYIQERLIGC
jgi:hypothetical protein